MYTELTIFESLRARVIMGQVPIAASISKEYGEHEAARDIINVAIRRLRTLPPNQLLEAERPPKGHPLEAKYKSDLRTFINHFQKLLEKFAPELDYYLSVAEQVGLRVRNILRCSCIP